MRTTLLLSALLACKPSGEEPAPTTGTGLLAAGCPVAGQAAARTLVSDDERPEGPYALATAGDVVLLNERAAFVIQDPTAPRTYYHYGGLPIDAVPLDGCAQAGPELFGELGLVIGELNLVDFPQSELRMFRGDRAVIVADGSDGGPAIVEVTGTDDRFWLVELELVRQAFESGRPKPLIDGWGWEIVVRYTLEPGDATLQIDVEARDAGGAGFDPLLGALVFPSDRTDELAWYDGSLEVGGFGLVVGLPWFGMTGASSYALAVRDANLARASISGVTALLDLDQLGSDGAADGVARSRLLLSAASQLADATAALGPHHPTPVPGGVWGRTPFTGRVVDTAGRAVGGATVDVQLPDRNGTWRTLDRMLADADGQVAGTLPQLRADDAAWRLVPAAPGRSLPAPVDVTLGATTDVPLTLSAPSTLVWDIRDGAGLEIPARIELIDADDQTSILYVTPSDRSAPVAPGTYTARVTRGYEYAPWTGSVTLPADGETTLAAVLDRVVDTTGWLAMDSHVHAEPSADSRVLVADRIRTAAAAGLEIVVNTDHEIVESLARGIPEAGLDDQIYTVVGQEVTATIPEHTNAWPLVPDPTEPRGGNPPWYGLDLGGIFALERERGAGIRQLNHPRLGCNWMCLIQWDRITGEALLEDPTLLALPATAELWSWDFDAVELMNGVRSPLLDPARPDASGGLDDWLSFLHHGHRVTALAVTDVHGFELPGSPRTFVELGRDDVIGFDERELVDAVLGGRAILSAGAFIRATVGDLGIGDLVPAPAGALDLDLVVEALSEIDVARVTVLVGCDEVARVEADDPQAVRKLTTTLSLSVEHDTTLVVLAWGEDPMPDGFEDYDPVRVPRAITNAIYVDADNDGVWTPPGGKACTYGDGRTAP